MATFQETIHKVDEALPSNLMTAAMIAIGVTFILVGIFSKSNILKATMITYAIVP